MASKERDFVVVPGQSYAMFENEFLDLTFTQIYRGSEIYVIRPDERDIVVTSDAIPPASGVVTAGEPYVAWHYAFYRGDDEVSRGLSPQDAFYNRVS